VFVPVGYQFVQNQTIIDRAKIPAVGITNDTSPNSFDLTGGQSLYTGAAIALQKKGCKRIGILATEGLNLPVSFAIKALKWENATAAYLPLNATDFSAQIAKVAGANPQCAAVFGLNLQYPQAITGLRQAGVKVPIATTAYGLTAPIAKALGSLSEGLTFVATTSPPSSVPKVVAAIRQHQPGVNVTNAGEWTYAWGKIITAAANKTRGDITAAKMMKALNGLRNVPSDGVMPPVSMIEQKNKNAKRNFDLYIKTYVFHGGKFTQPSKWFSVADIYNKAAG